MCRVPTFMAAAFAASRTDNVATVPAGIAAELGHALDLTRVRDTDALARGIEVAQILAWSGSTASPGTGWILGGVLR